MPPLVHCAILAPTPCASADSYGPSASRRDPHESSLASLSQGGWPRARGAHAHEVFPSGAASTWPFVPPAGVEPATWWVEATRSVQLSYGGVHDGDGHPSDGPAGDGTGRQPGYRLDRSARAGPSRWAPSTGPTHRAPTAGPRVPGPDTWAAQASAGHRGAALRPRSGLLPRCRGRAPPRACRHAARAGMRPRAAVPCCRDRGGRSSVG